MLVSDKLQNQVTMEIWIDSKNITSRDRDSNASKITHTIITRGSVEAFGKFVRAIVKEGNTCTKHFTNMPAYTKKCHSNNETCPQHYR